MIHAEFIEEPGRVVTEIHVWSDGEGDALSDNIHMRPIYQMISGLRWVQARRIRRQPEDVGTLQPAGEGCQKDSFISATNRQSDVASNPGAVSLAAS